MFVCALCEASEKGTAVKKRHGKVKICTWCEAELQRTGRGFCNDCLRAFPLTEIRDGKYCRACKHARNAAYYAANRDRERARSHHYYNPAEYAAKRDMITARNRAKYAANPEPAKERARRNRSPYSREYARNYYAMHRAERAAYGRQYRLRRKLAILRGWK